MGTLWQKIMEIGSLMTDGWVVASDFNSILHQHERCGGAPYLNSRGAMDFGRVIQDCELMDMGFQGNLFTW